MEKKLDAQKRATRVRRIGRQISSRAVTPQRSMK